MYAQLIVMCKSVFHSTMLWIELTQRDSITFSSKRFFFLEILTTWKQRMRSRNHQVYLWLIYHRESVADGAERAVGPGVMFFPHFFVFNISHEIWLREVFFCWSYLGKNDKAASKYPGDHPFSRVIVGSREILLIYASLRLFFKGADEYDRCKNHFHSKGGFTF